MFLKIDHIYCASIREEVGVRNPKFEDVNLDSNFTPVNRQGLSTNHKAKKIWPNEENIINAAINSLPNF